MLIVTTVECTALQESNVAHAQAAEHTAIEGLY